MPLLLLAGIAAGRLPYAAVASGAAFCVGFGAARDLSGRRWGAMIAAAAGTTVTVVVGCLAGQQPLALTALAGVAAAACALLVGGFYPGPISAALTRGAAVLAGGAAQLVFVMALARIAPAAAGPLPRPPPQKPPSPKQLYAGHAIRASLCVCASLWIARALGLANGYWAPMTAMIVLKPGLSDTRIRGLARIGGTLVGGALATLFAAAVGAAWPLLVVGVGVAATASFALQKAHYAILTSAITATVMLLLTLAGAGHPLANAEHRLIATLIGGALALVAARILPHRPAPARPAPDQVAARTPA